DEVILDGKGSLSPREKSLRYYWKQRGGPFIRVFDRTQDDVLRFTPEEEGKYTFELVVSDGELDSLPNVCVVNITKSNERPIAVVEAPSYAVTGAIVKLDGSRSFDKEGAKLTYNWKQISGPRVREYHLVDNQQESIPSFKAYESGTYTFELVVNDGFRDSRPSKVSVEVQNGNRPPVAKTSGSMEVKSGESALLQGAGYDADGDDLNYTWNQISGPVILEGTANQQSLTLCPNREGTYVFQLKVSDGKATSKPAICKMVVGNAGTVEPEDEFAFADGAAPAEITLDDEGSQSLVPLAKKEEQEQEKLSAEKENASATEAKAKPGPKGISPKHMFKSFINRTTKTNKVFEPELDDDISIMNGPDQGTSWTDK
ncbi:MAG: PKD domain-containing protein, partial [Planctomycetes bacterium]|nr:PKD domain-containing protein [Planctomycetota bacterium]